MSSFTKPLIVKFIDGKYWELYNEFDFLFIDKNGIKRTIEIPCGFITDFASIPRPFWPIIKPTGLIAKAAIVHDYLYANKIFDRKTCDEIFYIAMRAADVSHWKAYICYLAVRLFGSKFYYRKMVI